MYLQLTISVLLSLQFSSFSLLRSFLKDSTPICTILLYSEVIKFFVCSIFVMLDHHDYYDYYLDITSYTDL